MITRDLAVGDLDAKWTPERRRGRYGLHADSTIWPLARAVAIQPSWFAGGDDARSFPYKDVAPQPPPADFGVAPESADLDVTRL